jgi:hypothetical protein
LLRAVTVPGEPVGVNAVGDVNECIPRDWIPAGELVARVLAYRNYSFGPGSSHHVHHDVMRVEEELLRVVGRDLELV